MLPFPIISKRTVRPPENTIITMLKTGGPLTLTNVNVSPNDYHTESFNAIQFNQGISNIQVGTGGIPSIWQIGNNTDFTIETYVKLTGTSTRILCGNLQNNGTGSWWMVLNNTFAPASAIALDGYSTTGAVQRFHFTTLTTLPSGVWHHIVLKRTGTSLTCTLNGTLLGTLTMTLGFQQHPNAFRVGDSTDNAYPFNGVIDSFTMKMQ